MIHLVWMALLLALPGAASAQGDDYNPQNPPDPMSRYQVTVSAEPAEAANVAGSGKYAIGATVRVSTSARANYEFLYWMQDGVRIDKGQTFNYVMEDKKTSFVAVYGYNPSNPSDPTAPNSYRLYLESSEEGSCTFNRVSGQRQEAGRNVWVAVQNITPGFVFQGWYLNGERVSSSMSLSFLMPDEDVTLTAQLVFDPSNPDDPASNNGQGNIENGKIGDVNGDEKINGLDIVELVSLIMDGGYTSVGDLYPVGRPDGKLSGMDLVEEVDLVMSQVASSRACSRLADRRAVDNALVMTEGIAGTKVLGVKSDKQYILSQMMVELSGNMSLTDITSDRHHVVAYRQLADNRYVVVCYSNKNLSFDANEKLLEFHYVGEGELSVHDVMMVGADKNDYYFSATMSGDATGISSSAVTQARTFDVYAVSGCLVRRGATSVSNLPKGVFVINGQKVVVR